MHAFCYACSAAPMDCRCPGGAVTTEEIEAVQTYEITTDWGVMRFSSDSEMGRWWEGLSMPVKNEISRPNSRWKAELLSLYRSDEACWQEIPDRANREYQAGVMAACSAIWHRVTGESLV